MSSIKLESNASGTGVFTIASPNSNTNRTLTLPDSTGTINTSGGANEVPAGSASAPAIYPTGDTNTGIFFPAADTVAFAEGGAEAMRIDSSGNVGINITPAANPKLQIKQSSNTTDGGLLITASDESGSAGIARLTDGGMTFRNAGAERMRIDSSGNVGIGTSSPSDRLQIASGGKIAVYRSDNTRAGFFYTDNTATIVESNSANSDPLRLSAPGGSGRVEFYTSGSERARITSDGKFLIGNTDGTGLLTIGSSKLAQGNQQNAITSGTTGTFSASNSSGGTCAIAADYISSAGTAVFSLDSATTNGYYFRTYDSGYDYRFRIAKSGSATNSTGSYGTISDARTKTVVGSASSQWDDIKQLNFIKYKLNKQVEFEQSEENKDGYVAPVMLGLVAQEVEQICPGLIEESADPDFDQVKVIKTSILYMKAVKALQEAQLRIETLEAQNAAFEARLAALEAK